MIEIIKIFLERLLDKTDKETIRKARVKENFREVGAALFAIYLSLVRVKNHAVEINRELAKISDRIKRYVDEGREDEKISTNLNLIMLDQRKNLLELEKNILDHSHSLLLLDYDLSNTLWALVGKKKYVLGYLSSFLVSPQNSNWGEKHVKKMGIPAISLKNADEVFAKLERSGHRYPKILEEAVDVLEIPDNFEMAREIKGNIDNWLENNSSKERVEEFEMSILKLRKVLVQNFSAEELLFDFGEPKKWAVVGDHRITPVAR